MSSHCKMESTTPDQINYAGVDIARDRLDYSLPDSRFGEKFQPRLLASADAAPVTLRELQGVGPVLAATLLAYVPELGQIDSPQLSALIGVAPFARDSGRILRPRHMRGGRAVTAARCNPILAVFYKRLVAAGKPKLVCLVAVMRKMLGVLNRMLALPQFVLVR